MAFPLAVHGKIVLSRAEGNRAAAPADAPLLTG
jgi:hypothetical protein